MLKMPKIQRELNILKRPIYFLILFFNGALESQNWLNGIEINYKMKTLIVAFYGLIRVYIFIQISYIQ